MFASIGFPQEKVSNAISICGQHPVDSRSALLVLKSIKLSGNEEASQHEEEPGRGTITIDAVSLGPTVWPAESNFISICCFLSSCFLISISN